MNEFKGHSHYSATQFYRFTLLFWFYLILGVLVLLGFQTTLILYYKTPGFITHYREDVWTGYGVGLFNHIRTLSYLLMPGYLVTVLFNTLSPPRKPAKYLKWFERYAVIIFLMICFVGIADFYYYKAFSSNFDYNLFTFREAKLPNTMGIYQDYPIIFALSVFLLLSFLLAKKLKFIRSFVLKRFFNWTHTKNILLISLTALLIVLTYKGWNTFKGPFSKSSLLNAASKNAVMALVEVINDNHKATQLTPTKLGRLGRYFNRYRQVNHQTFSFHDLFTKTPKNEFLETHPPHVVYVQLEGMGSHFTTFDNKPKDMLLGELATHFKNDILFKHFVSGYANTYRSTAGLLLSGGASLFHPPFSRVSYLSSIARPFKKAGYETVFITASSSHSSDFDTLLPRQGFDKVIGEEEILKKYPDAERGAWGVFDEYAFRYANEVLSEASHKNKCIFLYVFTITNHTPYQIPSHYQPLPISDDLITHLAQVMNIPKARTKALLLSYQYTNHMFGQFISKVNASPWGTKTIIAATGDHNQHEMLNRYEYLDEKNAFLHYSVPFYLHVPKAYLTGKTIDPYRAGSHKDIFPTLFNLALSNVAYQEMGDDLLAGDSSSLAYGLNFNMVILNDGIIPLEQKNRLFYPFEKRDSLYVKKGQPLTGLQKKSLKRVLAYKKLLYWQYQWQAYNAISHCHHDTCFLSEDEIG